MPKELVISAAPHETRVAILEDGLLCEIYIEREKEFALVGSIYKGRVTRVLPGMQSAFVEIGLDSDAFLYVGDFLENLEDYDHVVTPVETKIEKMEQQGGAVFAPSSAASAADGSPSADGTDAAASASAGQDAQPPSTDAAPGNLDAEEPGDRQPNFAQMPNSAPRSGAPQQFNRQDRGNDRGGQDRGRGGRRGGRGGRWNRGSGGSGGGGNRGNDRRPPAGRDLPQAKYASPRPLAGRPYEAPPATTPQEEVPSDYTPVILPGESLAKYKDRGTSSSSSSSSLSSSPSAASSAPAHGGGSHGGGSQSGLPASLYAAPGQVDTPAPREEFVAPASEMLEAVVIPQPALQQPDVHVASHGAHGDLSEDEISALTEQLAEARHEEAHAEAEASAGTSMLGEEVPPAPAGNSEAEEFRAEADAQEREDALSASAEGIEGGSEHEVGSENEDEQEHDDELAVEAEANEGSTSADMEAADGNEGDAGPQPGNVEQADGASSDRQPGFNPTSARVSQPNRARFQRPARRGGRPQRGNRPHRQHDHGHGQAQQAARRPQLISEMLKAGQEIIVQIAKEPLGKKGARITSHVALPGRFLVYMPTVNHIGVSRRIASADERSRLRRLVGESKATFPGGFIVRTAAEGAPDDEIRADVEFLGRTWEKIRTQSEPRKAPSLLHRDLNLVERILRDYVSNDYTAIWIDNQEEYSKVVEFVGRFQPKLVSRVKLYTKPAPIFEEFGIQQELDKALRPKVWLKSGGYIVINHTEALVAIDVNTGKYVGRGGTRLEDTIVKTNLEAVKEIVRQIRLRDLGGIIVLDFIDMEERRNRDKVMAALDSALRADRAPSKALSFNEFGLVAVTRKRTKQALERVLCQPCPYCTGSGMVKSVPTICYEIQAEARKMAPELDSSTLTLRAHPEIAKALKTREASLIEELEQGTRKSVIIQADPTLHWEQYDIY